MAKEGTELERVPLARDASYERQYSSQPSVAQIEVLDEDSRPSTAGKNVPAINWGDKKVSPSDLEVCHSDKRLLFMSDSYLWRSPLKACCHPRTPPIYTVALHLQKRQASQGALLHLNATYIQSARFGMLRRAWSQALKTRVAREPPWKTACSLVSAYFQQNLLEDFYRRQNDIIDSLMEVSLPSSAPSLSSEAAMHHNQLDGCTARLSADIKS